jgi:hypothetical protein
MDWLRSSVFGGAGGSIAQQQRDDATEAGEPTSPGPPSPSPRLRKRNKRDIDGIHYNLEDDNGNNIGNVEGNKLPLSVLTYSNVQIDLAAVN